MNELYKDYISLFPASKLLRISAAMVSRDPYSSLKITPHSTLDSPCPLLSSKRQEDKGLHKIFTSKSQASFFSTGRGLPKP